MKAAKSRSPNFVLSLLLCLSVSGLPSLSGATTPATARPILMSQMQREQRQTVITLQRTACFGFCPMYKLTIYGDGRVIYEGDRFVKVKGKQTTTISPNAVRQLIREFNRVNYFALQDEYTGGHTDAPSAITALTIGKRTKTVHHYQASPDAPPALTNLENRIDAIVNSKQWIGTDSDRFPTPPTKDP